jgi:ParB family chromosome partitioning protein
MMSAAKNKGLGKGLGALFDEAGTNVPAYVPEAGESGGVLYADIHDIKPNARQPRKYFRETAINELAESIKTLGLIQPVIVRAIDQGYELVAGERRWRAAKKAGLKTIPCVLSEISDEQDLLLAAFIENTQREDLNPIEEPEALQELLQYPDMTQEKASAKIGKSRPYISNALRLLKLPEEVREYLADGKLSGGHGKAIAALNEPAAQVELAEYLIKNESSVREAELLAADPRFNTAKPAPKNREKPKNSALLTVEEELRGILGTKVSISRNSNRGKIELSYYSREELEGLIDTLRTLGTVEK